jgi:hypothetical protein
MPRYTLIHRPGPHTVCAWPCTFVSLWPPPLVAINGRDDDAKRDTNVQGHMWLAQHIHVQDCAVCVV